MLVEKLMKTIERFDERAKAAVKEAFEEEQRNTVLLLDDRQRAYNREAELKTAINRAAGNLRSQCARDVMQRGLISQVAKDLDAVLVKHGYGPISFAFLKSDLPEFTEDVALDAGRLVDDFLASGYAHGYRSIPREELKRRIAVLLRRYRDGVRPVDLFDCAGCADLAKHQKARERAEAGRGQMERERNAAIQAQWETSKLLDQSRLRRDWAEVDRGQIERERDRLSLLLDQERGTREALQARVRKLELERDEAQAVRATRATLDRALQAEERALERISEMEREREQLASRRRHYLRQIVRLRGVAWRVVQLVTTGGSPGDFYALMEQARSALASSGDLGPGPRGVA